MSRNCRYKKGEDLVCVPRATLVRLDGQIRGQGRSWEVSDPGCIRMNMVVLEARCNERRGRWGFH